MRNVLLLPLVLVFLAGALVTGCAKKPAEQAQEVTPPVAAPTAPAPQEPAMDARGVEGAPGASAAMSYDKKIYFAFDRFDLNPASVGVLNELAALLKSRPGLKLTIEGHCDERGTNEYNLALGERRAKSAMNYLVTQGIDAARITTVSYGEERPADPRSNEEAWAKNRRDEFILTE